MISARRRWRWNPRASATPSSSRFRLEVDEAEAVYDLPSLHIGDGLPGTSTTEPAASDEASADYSSTSSSEIAQYDPAVADDTLGARDTRPPTEELQREELAYDHARPAEAVDEPLAATKAPAYLGSAPDESQPAGFGSKDRDVAAIAQLSEEPFHQNDPEPVVESEPSSLAAIEASPALEAASSHDEPIIASSRESDPISERIEETPAAPVPVESDVHSAAPQGEEVPPPVDTLPEAWEVHETSQREPEPDANLESVQAEAREPAAAPPEPTPEPHSDVRAEEHDPGGKHSRRKRQQQKSARARKDKLRLTAVSQPTVSQPPAAPAAQPAGANAKSQSKAAGRCHPNARPHSNSTRLLRSCHRSRSWRRRHSLFAQPSFAQPSFAAPPPVAGYQPSTPVQPQQPVHPQPVHPQAAQPIPTAPRHAKSRRPGGRDDFTSRVIADREAQAGTTQRIRPTEAALGSALLSQRLEPVTPSRFAAWRVVRDGGEPGGFSRGAGVAALVIVALGTVGRLASRPLVSERRQTARR